MIASRRLGRTNLRLSEFGLGTAAFGNLYQPVTDVAAAAALGAALDAGVQFFDTAPYYGFGLAERRVGDALRAASAGAAVLSTKVGRLLDPAPDADVTAERHGFRSTMPFEPRFDYSYDGVLRSHEASLQRLGLARVSILLVHDIGALTHGDEAPRRLGELTEGGGFRALARLREEGSIDAIGVGVNEVAICLDLLGRVPLDVILLAGRYTLLEQGALDSFFPACAAAGVSVVVGGPFNSGILASAATEQGCYDYDQAPAPIVERVGALRSLCTRHDVPLPAAALQFVLAHPQVASVIPGARSAAEVTQNLAHYRAAVPPVLWRDLIDAGLIARNAPVPA